MKLAIALLSSCCLIFGCKSSGSSSSGGQAEPEPVIATFNTDPPLTRTVFSLDRGREITYHTKFIARITLAKNISRDNLRDYEVEVFVNTDGVFDGQGTDTLYHKKEGEKIFTRPPAAENWRDERYVYFGGNNETGVGQIVITSEVSFRPDDKLRIADGELYYYVRLRYWGDRVVRSSADVPLSEDIFPDDGEYTNAAGVQMDEIDDYLGSSNAADISFVELQAIID